ncbi:MAG: riboflavin kinase [Candidatus Peribacteraceae bacterium]
MMIIPPHTMLSFTAPAVPGSGRGRLIGFPTVNVDVSAVPPALAEGIYACMAQADGDAWQPAAMHYGPRPVFHDSRTCEVHFLDDLPDHTQPQNITVRVLDHIRDIRDFPSTQELQRQIDADCRSVRAILAQHAVRTQTPDRQ